MDAAGEGKGKRRRALKREKAELEMRLAEVGGRLEAALARAAALEAQNAETAARLDAATAEWEVQRQGYETELRALGEDVGNALADRAAAILRAEEEGKAARDRLSVERGQLAVELSNTREALAAALAEAEQLKSHVAQLRAALDDTAQEQNQVAPLREELGIALAARAAAELRFEDAAKAVRERDLLRARLTDLEERYEAIRAERESLAPRLAELQDRVVQASTELNETVLEHNRQMAAWYAERESLEAQQARLAKECDELGAEVRASREALDEASAAAEAASEAGDRAAAEIAALNELRASHEAEIERLIAVEAQCYRLAAGAADLIDADPASSGDPVDMLRRARRRLRELEVSLDRAEVERDRLGADLAKRLAAEEASPWRKAQRLFRHLLPRRLPLPAFRPRLRGRS
jgi:chromosome segregation ATPase